MSDRLPTPADPFEEAGLPATDDALPGKLITGDAQDDVSVPGDRPLAVTEWGTTAYEEAVGEPLDLRLSREEPDVWERAGRPASGESDSDNPYPEDRDEHVGRLVDLDEGAHADVDAEMVGTDAGTDGGGFSAEERAMHIVHDAES